MESTQSPFFLFASLHNKPIIRSVIWSSHKKMTAILRHLSRPFVCGFVLLFLPLAVWAQTAEAPPTDVTQMSTSELEKQASLLVGTQKYAEAVPLLSELLTRLSETKEPQLLAKVENFRYFLGLGHVFNNDWERAAATFETFLKSHPKSNRYRRVLELYGDTLVQSKQNAEAAEQYKKLLEMKLPDTETFPIIEKLASCYMRDKKWSEAIPVLLSMLQKGWTPEQREQAVVWLAQSYIESDQGGKLSSCCPIC